MKTLHQLLGTLFLSFFFNCALQSQTFNGQGNLPVPPGAPGQTVGITTSNASVNGVGVLGTCTFIDNVTINFEHTWVGDVAIFLISPAGTVLELTSGNGGSGDNFQVTTFSDAASLNVVNGAPPYNGGFRPEGRQQSTACFCSNANPIETWTFANTYTGENADGIWQLYINDYVSLDVGTLISWSITFAGSGTPPVANPASMEACDVGGGQATFDLTTVESTVNGGTGDPVLWFTDMAGTISIPNPSAYMSGSTTVYAVVQGGSCNSDPVPVTLTVNPTPVANPLNVDVCDNCAGFAEVDLTVYDNEVNGGSGNPVSWWGDPAATAAVPNPESVQIFGASYWATVSNGTCESEIVEVDFTLIIPNCGAFTSLSACDDGNGTATFDLTSVNNVVNNGTNDDVIWYEDQAATIPISDPTAYVSSGGFVFAVVDDGTCPSPAVAMNLIVTPGIDPGSLSMALNPFNLCGPGDVLLSFNLPNPSAYDVVIQYGNASSGFTTWSQSVFSGVNYSFSVTETTEFQWLTLEGGGCSLTFDPPLTLTVTVQPAVTANPATLEACGIVGSAIFDLTEVDEIVNGGTGVPVSYWSDPGATVPITNPTAYDSPGGTIYATVGTGPCASAPVAITLTVLLTPVAAPYPINACDSGNGTGAFDLTSIENFVAFGTGNPVTWYADPGATNPISNPSNYISGEGAVYAVVSNGPCDSAPSQIDLNLVPTPTIDNSFITANPTTLCGPGNVLITFTMPEGGVPFTVQMDYGNPTSGYQNYIGVNVFDGSTVPFVISETTEFILNSVEVPNNGLCSVVFSNPITVTVIVEAPPQITILNTPTICEGDQIDLSTLVSTTSSFPITFHTGSPATPANQLASTLVSPTVTTTYEAFIDGGTGCTTQAPVTVFVDSPTTPVLGSATVCENETNFDLTTITDPNFPNGSWSGPGVTGTVFNATGLSGNVVLTYEPGAGCTNPATTTITIDAFGNPNLGTATVCESETNFDLTTLLDPAYPAGTWSGPGVTGQVFNATGLSGNVTLTFTPTASVCANSSTTILTLTPAGLPNLSTVTVCESETNFDLTTLLDPAYPTGTWSGPGVTGQTFNATGLSGNVTLTFTPAASLCANSATTNLAITPAGLPNLGTASVCETETNFDLTTLLDPAYPAGTWSGPGVSGAIFNATGLSGNVTLTFSPASGICANPANTTLTLTPPTIPVLGTASVCENETIFDLNQLIDPSIPAGTWSGQGVTGSNFNATGLSGAVTLTFTPAGGVCASPATTIISVESIGIPNLGTASVCEDETSFDLSTIADPAFPIGTWVGAGVNGSTFNATGLNGNVTLTFTPTGNCAGPATTNLTVLPIETPILGTAEICEIVTNFDLNQLADPNFPGGTWSGAGVTGNVFVATGQNGPVTLTYTPNGNCTQPAVTIVNVSATLIPQLGTAQICETSAPIPLSVLLDPAFPTGTWSGPGVTGNQFNPAGLSGAITLTFESDDDCAETATTTVNIDDEPDLVQLITPEICEGESFDLGTAVATNSGLPVSFHTATPPTAANELPSENVAPSISTTYFAFVDGGGDCTATLPLTVNVSPLAQPQLASGEVCENSTSFDLTELLDPAYPVGTWSGPGVSGNLFLPAGQSGTVLLTFSSTAECVLPATAEITVSPLSIPILGTASICDSETNYDLSQLVDPLFSSGEWSGPGVNGNFLDATGLSGSLTLTFLADGDCVSPATTTVLVGEEVVPNLGAISLCSGDNPFDLSSLLDPVFPDGVWSGPGVNNGEFSPAGQSGNVTLTFTPSADCALASTTDIVVNEAPTTVNLATDCNSQNNEYIVSFEIENGDPSSYTVNGQPSGTSFNSAPIPSGATYSFEVDDINACGPVTISGSFDCSCTSFAGTMDLTGSPFELCEGDVFTANFNLNAILDSDDVLNFIFHDEAGPTLGNVFEINDEPIFNLPAGAEVGVTYYVSAVVGNNDGTGNFDPSDACLSIAAGVPVVFVSPSVDIGPGGNVCASECLEIPLAFSGPGPFDFYYEISTSIGVFSDTLSTSNGATGLSICPIDYGVENGSIALVPIGMNAGPNCELDLLNIPSVQINILEASTSTIASTLCEGETLLIGGEVFSQSNPTGTLTIEGGASNGCDSLIIVDLQFSNPDTTLLDPVLCAGSALTVNGTVYSEANPSGVEVLSNSNGCDSVVIVSLSFDTQVTFNLSETLCEGENVLVNGTVYDSSNPVGSEFFPGGAASGCDSLVNVNLSFYPTAEGTIEQSLCAGGSLVINGTIYDESNPAGTEILPNSSFNGCDSIIQVDLEFNDVVTFNLTQTLCSEDSLVVNGNVYTASNPVGTEIIPNGSILGCDSVVVIDLEFEPVPSGVFSQNLCEGESVTVNGTVYDETNPSGMENLENASFNGCDSVVMVNLFFFEEAVENLNLELCAGESVEINGVTYDESNPTGTELFPNGSAFGCDSTLFISLSFLPEITVELNETLSSGGSIVVNGTVYDASNPTGVEVIANGAVNGCDSTILVSLTFIDEIQALANVIPPTCFGDTDGQIIIENVSGGTGPYLASLNSQPAFSINTFPFVLGSLPSGNYTLLITDNTGQATTLELNVSSVPEVVLELGDNQEIELGEDAVLNGVTNIFPAVITWEPETYLDCVDCLDPVVSRPEEGVSYTLTISDENGCSASDEVSIAVRKSRRVFVPNAFSPNGDGINDAVTVFAGDEVVNVRSFKIFDRWGGAVYENFNFPPNDPMLGWDGMHRGEIMNPAVFVYFAEVELLDERLVLLKGEVSLIR